MAVGRADDRREQHDLGHPAGQRSHLAKVAQVAGSRSLSRIDAREAKPDAYVLALIACPPVVLATCAIIRTLMALLVLPRP